MCYICDSCHLPQPPRTPLNLKVVETRQVTYLNRHLVDDVEKDVVTKGWEVVREERWCPDCKKLVDLDTLMVGTNDY